MPKKRVGENSIMVLVVVFFLLSFAFTAPAATKYWAAKEKGNWSSANDWAPSGIPAKDDDVSFDSTSIKDCIIDISVEVNSITLDNALYTGTVTQNKKDIKVKKGFYLKGSKDNPGRWLAEDNIIESSGDWINDIGLQFDYYSSIVRLTGSGKLAGFLFNQLACASSGHTTELTSWTAISGIGGNVVLGSGTLTGKGALTFYKGGIIFKESPPVISITTINFQGTETIPGATYNCRLSITGATEDKDAFLKGDLVCESLFISNGTKEKTTALHTSGYKITVTKGNLTVGAIDKYGALKCNDSVIKVKGNVIINQGSCIFKEASTWDIEGEIINQGGTLTEGAADL